MQMPSRRLQRRPPRPRSVLSRPTMPVPTTARLHAQSATALAPWGRRASAHEAWTDRSRTAKVTNKNINVNYVSSRTAALPPLAQLDATSDKSIPEQLRPMLSPHRPGDLLEEGPHRETSWDL